jgi:hypothetical protein
MSPATRAYIDRVVASAPPISAERMSTIAAILRPHLPAPVAAPARRTRQTLRTAA